MLTHTTHTPFHEPIHTEGESLNAVELQELWRASWKVHSHRRSILFVLTVQVYLGWQVWCPFTHTLAERRRRRRRNCWHGHLSHEFGSNGENVLTPPTVSGRNLNKEVKLNANNFFSSAWTYSLALIFHTCLIFSIYFYWWATSLGTGFFFFFEECRSKYVKMFCFLDLIFTAGQSVL